MNKGCFRTPDYLDHILQAIGRIRRYTAAMSEEKFLASEMVQDAVVRNIEIIGEAARNIMRHHPEFASQHPEVPWSDVYLMRNQVSHGYFSVDLEIVWKTLQRDIPQLERQVSEILKQLG